MYKITNKPKNTASGRVRGHLCPRHNRSGLRSPPMGEKNKKALITLDVLVLDDTTP
jgi:hypothetical protein